MTVSWSFLSRHVKFVLVVLLSAMLLLGSMVPAPTALASGGEVGVNWFDSGAQDADLQDMQNAGVKWVRVGLFFQASNLSHLDYLLGKAAAHQIKVLPAVYPVPRNDYGTGEQRQAYLSWLSQTVARYRDRIHVWEVGNEPNLEPFWNIPGAPGEASWNEGVHRYVLHLAETYSTIKASDPSATVLLGGLSGNFMEQYIDRLIGERAYRYFDAMNLHPYASNPQGVVARVRSAQRQMSRAPGLASKPLWITEFGWQTTWPGSFMYVTNEEVKARYLGQTIITLREMGITAPIFCYVWYEWADITRQGASNVNGFGLVRRASTNAQPVRLPAYYALRSVAMRGRTVAGSDHEPSRARRSPTVASRSRLGAPAPPKMMDVEAARSSSSVPSSAPQQVSPGPTSSSTPATLPLAVGGALFVLLGAIGLIASRRGLAAGHPRPPERQDGSTPDRPGLLGTDLTDVAPAPARASGDPAPGSGAT